MRNEHPHGVRMIWIDVEDVRLTEKIGQQQIVLTAVPLATDPADAVHQPQGRKLRNEQVLGPLAIELDQVDLVDPEVRYLRPELLDGQRGNLDAKLAESRLKRFPDVRNIIGDPTVRYGERKQALAWLGRNRCVDPEQLRLGNMTGVLGHQLKALRMWLDSHHLGVGPIVVGHHGKTTNVRPNINDRADIVGT